MNRRTSMIIILLTGLLLIHGCQKASEMKLAEMNAEELQDVRALQDEFTRSFIQSAKEAEDGYYPFLSGTGNYEMLFPAEGLIVSRGYGLEKNYEGFLLVVKNNNGTASQIKVDYYANADNEGSPIKLKSLEGRTGQGLNFTKLELDTKEIYYAPIEFDSNIFGIAAYIQNISGDGGLHIVYNTDCPEEQLECTSFRKKEEKKMIHWIRSIEFVNE